MNYTSYRACEQGETALSAHSEAHKVLFAVGVLNNYRI